MASPFKRKPALVRTYGSSSSAQPPPPPPKPLSALDHLLADSDSSDEDGLAGEKTAQAPAPKRAKTAATAKGKDPVSRSRPRSTSAAALLDDDDDADQSRWEENQAALSAQTRASRSGGATAVTSTRSRTKSSGSQQQQQQRTSPRKRAAHTPVYDEQEGADSAEDEEVLPRPSPPRRKVKRTDSSNNHSDPAATLTRTGKPSNATTSIPPAAAPSSKKKKPPPPSSKDRNLGKAVERDDDEIPAPTAFVPLAERLKQASHGSHDQSSSANQPPRARERRTPSPSPPKRPRPRKAATAPTPTPTPALSSPRRPPPADDQSSPLSLAKPTPGATRRPAASPVKDLSAVFSRFATRTAAPIATTTSSSSSSGGVVVSVEQHKEEPSLLEGADSGPRAQVSQRPPAARPTAGLKRARSLVGGMAGPIAKRLGGTTRSPNSGDDDPDGDGDGGLGRTFSQPGSSVLSPPSRPNRPRPPLGSSLSVPVILSPTKSSPVRGGGGGGGGNEIASPTTTVGGGGSGSPLRRPHSPNVGLGAGGSGNGGLAALLGGAGAMTAEGNGPTRTYASGRRTVRAPVEPAEEGGGGGGEAFASARTATTSRMLATVPGSSRPQSGDASTLKASSMVGVAAPPPRRETYASLRLLWGIDAEENLDADEDQDSQDRGAKVVGSGTLRRQGEGKRWMDELGWMCDGLRAGGGGEGGGDRGAARASAIELVGKALEKDWIRRLKSSGQAETVYLALRTATSSGGGSNSNATPRTPATMTADRVLDAAIAVTLALFVKDQRLVEPLLRISPADVQRNAATRKTASPPDDPEDEPGSDGNSDLLEVLTALLNREWASDEIGATKTAAAAGQNQAGGTSGRSRVSKVLKSDTRHLQALRDLIDKSSLFSADDAAALPVSIRSLVLLTIRSIAFFAPRPIFQPQSMLCTAGVLEHVVRDFLNECAGLQARISKYQEGLDLLAPPPAQPQVSIPILSLHLSIFEATSLVGPLAFELISSPDLLPPLSLAFTQLAHVAVLLALDRNPGPPSTSRVPAASEDALRTLVAVLGILLALSSDERWSVAFVEAELLPTLVRAALLSRRVAGEGVSLSAPTEAAAEEAPQPSSPSQGGTDAAASDATTTTTSSEAEEVAAATAAAGDGNGRSRLIWDVLSLSVGVLANVLDATPESQVGDSLLELSVNPACRGKRKCARACRCPDDEQETALAALCRLAIDPLDDAVDPVYRASVHGFLRLALGLSLLSSEAAESTITAALEAHPVVLGHVLDALEGFASLYDEREQARRSMLALPSAGRVAQASGANVAHGQRDLDDDDDDNEEKEEEEPTQVDLDETQLGEGEGDGKRVEAGDADSERIVRMREVVQRLRRRVR